MLRKKTTARSLAKPAAMSLPKVPAWLPELEKWERAPYDGIKGCPPLWIPEPNMNRLYAARGLLFHLVRDQKASYTEIRARFDYLNKEKYGAAVLAITKDTKLYDDDLHYLVTLYQASKLGPIEGLRRLAGEVAVVGFRVRTGHTKRKAAFHKPEIQQIGKRYWETNPKATTKDILNNEEFHTYMKDKKPYADRTYQNWLREVDSRPLSSKRGPRSRKR